MRRQEDSERISNAQAPVTSSRVLVSEDPD